MADDWAGPAIAIDKTANDSEWAGPAIDLPQPSLMSQLAKGTLGLAKKAYDFENASIPQAIGRGAEKSLLGIGETFGEPGATQEIQKMQKEPSAHPWAENVGEALPFLVGGDLGIGAKAASLVPKAAEGAGWLAKTGYGVLRGLVGGGATGGAMGVESGVFAPTGDPDAVSRAKKKGEVALERGAEGVLVGAPIGLAGKALEGVGNVKDLATGKGSEEAAAKLREAAKGRATGVATEEAAKSEEALKKAAQIKPSLDQEIERTDAARGAAGDAEANVNRLTDELKQQPTMDAKTFGDRVRKLSEDTYKKYREARARESGYSAAVAESTDDPIVNVTPINEYLNEWEKSTANANDRAIIAYLRGETEAGLSPKQADSLRKVLDEAYRTKSIKVSNTTDANAATAGYRIARIHAMLVKSLSEADPRLAEAVKKFRELSRPLDAFERKGPLAPALKSDRYSNEPLAGSAELVGKLLTKTRGGASPFARLIAEDPGLKNDARQFFQGLMSDADTPEKMAKVIKDNRDALEQTGLLPEFSAAQTQFAGAAENVARMKAETAYRQGNVDVLQKSFKEAEDAGKVSDKVATKFKALAEGLDRGNLDHKDVANRVESTFKALWEDKKITDDEWKTMLGEVDKLRATIHTEETTRAVIKHAVMGAVIAALGYPIARDLHITTKLF